MKLRTLGTAAMAVGLMLCFACGEDSKDTTGAGGSTGAATGGSASQSTTGAATGGGNNASTTATGTGGGTSDTPTNDGKCLASIDKTKKVSDPVAACKQLCKTYPKCPGTSATDPAICEDYMGCADLGTGPAACDEVEKVYWACILEHVNNMCGAKTCCDDVLGTEYAAACST